MEIKICDLSIRNNREYLEKLLDYNRNSLKNLVIQMYHITIKHSIKSLSYL